MNHEHISSDMMTKLKQKVLHLTRGLWFSDIEITMKNMNDFPLGASPSLRAVSGCSITIILANHVYSQQREEWEEISTPSSHNPTPTVIHKEVVIFFVRCIVDQKKKNSMRVNQMLACRNSSQSRKRRRAKPVQENNINENTFFLIKILFPRFTLLKI